MNITDEYWAYFLRVGADLTLFGGGFHGPIFKDGSFEFVPIPEDDADENYLKTFYGRFTYGNTVDRYRQYPFAQYIRDRKTKTNLLNKHMHPDPDFVNATYGDITKTKEGISVSKAAALKYLIPGNLLVFCASLDPYPSKEIERERALYIIGYLEVKCVHDFFQKRTKEERWSICKKFRKRNAHCAWASYDEMSEHYFRNLVLVEGESCTLLDKAIQLTDEKYCILPHWTKEWGLRSTHFFRGGRWLPQKDRDDCLKRKGYVSRLRHVLGEYGKYHQQLTVRTAT